MDDLEHATWFYGPKGASKIFEPGETVPDGWHDHPSKVEDADAKPDLDL